MTADLVSLFLLLLLTASSLGQTTAVQTWRQELPSAVLVNRSLIADAPERNFSGGIARWDSAHILVYALTSTLELATRDLQQQHRGPWEFRIDILRSDNGSVERSLKIPAASFSSELAVTAGGLTVSDPGYLEFYSRDFVKIGSAAYAPLDSHWSQVIPNLGPERAGRLLTSPDQRVLLLLDVDPPHARIVTFDGLTYAKMSDEIVGNIEGRSVSLGNVGYVFASDHNQERVYFAVYGSRPAEVSIPRYPRSPETRHQPIYIGPGRWLDVFHKVRLFDSKTTELLYAESGSVNISAGPALISPDDHLAAVFAERVRKGGLFDRDYHRASSTILLIPLDSKRPASELKLEASAGNLFALAFMDPSTLLVLSDRTVTAYKLSLL
jgi:hypothetical protein